MEKSQKGSNFYMLTAQILNDKNLNHAEKLTMAILNGLAYEDGTCFPSNEWLAEKLDIKERAVQDIISNLEKNNYIKRQFLSCASNPFKKTRIIYINTNFKLCLPDAENCTPEDAENCAVDMQKTAPIIYKKNLIEEEPRTSSSPPPQAVEISLKLQEAIKKTKPDIKKPNIQSWAKDIDLMLRIDKRNIEIVEKIIDWLPSSEFWSKNILSADKFRLQFDKLELEMKRALPKTSLNDLQLIKKLETRSDLINRKIIVLGGDYVEFPQIRDAYFKVGEPGFREKVLNSLRKAGVPISC